MTTIRLMTIMWFVALLSMNDCNANEAPKPDQPAGPKAEIREDDSYVIDSQTGGVAGIVIGMTEAEIREAGWPYETRFEMHEGDEYKIYIIRLAGDAYLKCTLDLDYSLAGIESSSVRIRDSNNLGVGSRLSELKDAYPSGRFVIGDEEGRFASFLTGTRLIFRFDPKDFEDSCFDYRVGCKVDENSSVKLIDIGKYAPE